MPRPQALLGIRLTSYDALIYISHKAVNDRSIKLMTFIDLCIGDEEAQRYHVTSSSIPCTIECVDVCSSLSYLVYTLTCHPFTWEAVPHHLNLFFPIIVCDCKIQVHVLQLTSKFDAIFSHNVTVLSASCVKFTYISAHYEGIESDGCSTALMIRRGYYYYSYYCSSWL